MMTKTEDKARGELYPAWTVVNPEDVKNASRVLDDDAVPVVDCVKTSIADKSRMLLYARDQFSIGGVDLLVDREDGTDYLNQTFKFHKEENQEVRGRVLQSFAQTSAFINEAINLKQVTVQGRYPSVVEKAGRRKDRVMSFIYALDFSKQLEDNMNKQTDVNIFDYMFFT